MVVLHRDPAVPSYTSGHSTFSAGASKILELFFGSDNFSFVTGPDVDVPTAPRSFTSFSAASDEAGQSRIYGGIHWQYDNTNALFGGRSMASFVFANYLRPLGDLSLSVSPSTINSDGGVVALRASYDPARPGEHADAYMAIRTPGDALLFVAQGGGLTADPVPFADNVVTTSFEAIAFAAALDSIEGIDPGTYTFLVAFTEHGSLQLLSNIATAAFNINPYSE